MAMAPLADITRNLVAGSFIETERGHYFEYSHAAEGEYIPFAGYTMKVWCGPSSEYRWAKISETRVYLVTDEDIDCSPIVDRWVIRKHRRYVF
jgi:hypothetical protein